MNTVLVAINAKYIHSNLAVWYFKANCNVDCGNIEVLEFSINDNISHMLAEIYRHRPNNIVFSCYIWNIDMVLKLIKDLKKIDNSIKIIIGGPEASKLECDGIRWDFIVRGEGDIKIPTLLRHIKSHSYEHEFFLELGENTLVNDLNTIKSPYTEEMLRRTKNKIVYFEASRGCPFNCSYCLSSTIKGVRYFDIERIKNEITLLVENNVRQIKFVDRTFNCNLERTKEILRFIQGFENKNINFHFEISAGIFDDELFCIIEQFKEGLVQFEIGIQTTNLETLKAINRYSDLTNELSNIRRLVSLKNIHIHVDLIAGLPYEDFDRFMVSFDTVYKLEAHHFQLGFLKLLEGTDICRDAEMYSYVAKGYAPYEVLCNAFITFDEICYLKDIEECLERYYNSMRFTFSLKYIIKCFFDDSPSAFYKAFAFYNRENGFLERSLSSRELYTVFMGFIDSNYKEQMIGERYVVLELLKLDFLLSDKSMKIPEGMNDFDKLEIKSFTFEFLKNESNIDKYLNSFTGIAPKEIFKQVFIFKLELDSRVLRDFVLGDSFITSTEEITVDGHKKEIDDYRLSYDKYDKFNIINIYDELVVLIDYSNKNKVTGLYEYRFIEKQDWNEK